jgi:hypothetical protein
LNKKQIAITLGIVCLILTMFVVIQIRTTNNANKVVSQTFTSNVLRNQVLKWKDMTQHMQGFNHQKKS